LLVGELVEQKLELGLKQPDALARGHARGEGDDVAQRPLCLREASDDVELVLEVSEESAAAAAERPVRAVLAVEVLDVVGVLVQGGVDPVGDLEVGGLEQLRKRAPLGQQRGAHLGRHVQVERHVGVVRA